MRQKIEVKGSLVGKRLDLAIMAANVGLSRRKVRKIIDIGGSYINRKRVRIASRTVTLGDTIELDYQEEKLSAKIATVELDTSAIIYESERYIAINKPAGLVSQPTRQQAVSHVCQSVSDLLHRLGRAERDLQLTHRLDRDTSGVMVLAKSSKAMQELTDQFRERTVKKVYHALCYGHLQQERDVSCLLSRIHPSKGRVQIERHSGKSSYTLFKPVEYFTESGMSLVACYPTTGRSHQIRVHLEWLGYPIVGDKVYGRGPAPRFEQDMASLIAHRHFLHAKEISFLDGAEQVRISAPYTEDMRDLLVKLDA